MPKRPIDVTLDAFELGELQTFKVILQTLDIDGWGIADALEHISSLTRTRNAPVRVLQRPCPKCKGQWIALAQVNHNARTMIGGNWKCQWYCPVCDFEEFSTEDIEKEAKPYLIDMLKEG